MLAHLDQQHRFAARRGAQRAHEAAGVLDAFDVEEYVFGARIGDHVVEHFAEVDVAFGTQRDHVRKADLVGQRPVENRGAQGAGLRNQADGAGMGKAMGEGQVDLAARTHDAETVGTEQAHAVTPGILARGAFQRGAAGPRFSEAAGNDDGVPAAGATAGIDDVGYGRRLGADHRDIESLRNRIHRRIAALSEYRFVLGIDKEKLARVARVEHVAHQRDANRVRRLRGADDGDGLRLEERVQVVAFVVHGGVPRRP